MNSALYVGAVRHRRFEAPAGEFRYRVEMVWLDLDELDTVFAGRWFWSTRRLAARRFRRSDYLGDPQVALADAVRDRVALELGRRPAGPVRMLTQLACFGFCFNPVTFYCCHAQDGVTVEAVLAEITNTPWGERWHYVVRADGGGRPLRASFAKQFHVSPFQPMEQTYDWALNVPGERLAVHMQNRAGATKVFDATLLLRRRPWNTRSLWAAALRHPWMTAKVIVAIHWHAFRLWCKRAPFHVHPNKRGA